MARLPGTSYDPDRKALDILRQRLALDTTNDVHLVGQALDLTRRLQKVLGAIHDGPKEREWRPRSERRNGREAE